MANLLAICTDLTFVRFRTLAFLGNVAFACPRPELRDGVAVVDIKFRRFGYLIDGVR